KEFLEQSRTVLAEHRRIFDLQFPKFQKGVFFFYFSSLDLNSHMLWRLIAPQHPAYDATLASQYGSVLQEFYQQMDQVLGEVLPKLDEHTTLLVLSDHGFAPYRRSFNLNTWLLNNGYITLKSDANPDDNEPLANVDWSKTRAYGLAPVHVGQRLIVVRIRIALQGNVAIIQQPCIQVERASVRSEPVIRQNQ